MKTAIVTGSTKGIGLAISKALLAQKFFVVMNYAHDTENAEAVRAELSRDFSGQFSIMRQPLENLNDAENFCNNCVKLLTGGGALTCLC